MTVTVPLTPEEEARLAEIAGDRGVSPEAFINETVKGILARGSVASGGAQPPPEGHGLEELFESFDSVNLSTGVNEAAFHRENWY